MSKPLAESKALLVRRWGEMGGYWGINRTMAEIYALMYVSTDPLCTDDVMQQLHISRGNASMNLRALVDWGLIERVHRFGERREYFQADTNVWHMFETIMRERRRREVEPILATIDRCIELVDEEGGAAPESQPKAEEYRRRLGELRDFLHTMGTLFDIVLQYGGEGLGSMAKLLVESAGGPVETRPNAASSAKNGGGARRLTREVFGTAAAPSNGRSGSRK